MSETVGIATAAQGLNLTELNRIKTKLEELGRKCLFVLDENSKWNGQSLKIQTINLQHQDTYPWDQLVELHKDGIFFLHEMSFSKNYKTLQLQYAIVKETK